MYEWGFGPCDDYMTVIKANAGQTSFTATVRVCHQHSPSNPPCIRHLNIITNGILTTPFHQNKPCQAAANKDGPGTKLAASVPLTVANAGQGLYVVFENLLGAPATFSNAEVCIYVCVYYTPADRERVEGG